MLFNSYIFVFLFFPVTVISYYLLNKLECIYVSKYTKYKIVKYTSGKILLIIMSLWFYAYFNYSYLFIIMFSIIVNFTLGRLIIRSNLILKKVLLILALCFNIGFLSYYKYRDFFVSNVNSIFSTDFNLLNIILPLAISFFTFQQIAYIIDSYKGEVPKYGFIDYSLFISFFPQLIAGPIVTHDEIIPQFKDETRKKINYENLSKGLMAFTFGLVKKVLIADIFANAVNYGYANFADLDSLNLLLVILFYTIQIYFDFSGYCDMATGIALMFNIELPMNFNSPYRAYTIAEFWNRWHMTLTRFFTKYIYIPLGGNRKGTIRTYINIMIVFLLSGFWHGADWSFILWGFMHGVFLVTTRLFKNWFNKLHSALNWLITFTFVNISWIYFRAESISDANYIVKSILHFRFENINPNISKVFLLREFTYVFRLFNWDLLLNNSVYVMLLWCIFILFAILHMKNTYERIDTFKPNIVNSLVVSVLLLWGMFSLGEISVFLYFNF